MRANIGTVALPFIALCAVIGSAGGCQHGINSVSGALYPPGIRATGTGWALGLGRVGQIGGPLVGGAMLAAGWAPRDIFLVAADPAFCVALGIAALGHLRRETEPVAMAKEA